ncbi:hypothetical protein L0P54_08755 [Anaerosalibacter bizertensis]|uniref:Uncharacterized protein n=1 Tax=Anaerosalibacter bizertensis TaxID=932217 RepID=A0A9Q4ABJ1_9FIRM|nr:hypothetical protein [Anaerosalibacter bizertensis]MBV1818237.1 hypothetical protein [Bacteroidales bacterium MSK.15.36]MCB5559388.1 hypothetical protein [Anaerosalibacter bizertensis]MCG4564581.1 hypothetical protein [Anaerosalibacter bizertensis]MCG4583078.1 hypothetical protein [Anaerosalibacter bizertensis]MCG4584475.1 hypothetical protein [Anaerosalibacter bizertensis]
MASIENDLKNLCLDFIDVLHSLEKPGDITKEEYEQYSKPKIAFLKKYIKSLYI